MTTIFLVISILSVVAAVHFKQEALRLSRELSGTKEELEGEIHQLKADIEGDIERAIEQAEEEAYDRGFSYGRFGRIDSEY